ncbi:MAG: hypothetical protein AAF358_17375 [Pseudomonadota bacterium]
MIWSVLSLGMMLVAAKLLAGNGRSVAGWALAFASAAPLVAAMHLAKAIFIWLALLGLAGFAITLATGLTNRSEGQQATAES